MHAQQGGTDYPGREVIDIIQTLHSMPSLKSSLERYLAGFELPPRRMMSKDNKELVGYPGCEGTAPHAST
jgi:hypothetical protein